MTGRWLLPAGDTGTPARSLDETDSGPLTEINLGPGAPFLQFRDLADFDELIAVLVAARHEHGEAQARHVSRQDIRDALAAVERGETAELLDPDCAAGKHQSCIGGPCSCSCHSEPGLRYQLPAPGPGVSLSVTVPAEHAEMVREAARDNGIDLGEPVPDLPRRAPLEAPAGEPTCDARDGQWVCTASPHGTGDHAAFAADGTVARQWSAEEPADA